MFLCVCCVFCCEEIKGQLLRTVKRPGHGELARKTGSTRTVPGSLSDDGWDNFPTAAFNTEHQLRSLSTGGWVIYDSSIVFTNNTTINPK